MNRGQRTFSLLRLTARGLVLGASIAALLPSCSKSPGDAESPETAQPGASEPARIAPSSPSEAPAIERGEPQKPADPVPEVPQPDASNRALVSDDRGIVRNGSFEAGTGESATDWFVAASLPPGRSDADARTGSFSMHSLLVNAGATPSEGLLRQSVNDVESGETYELSFWAKEMDYGVSYVQEYEVKWVSGLGSDLGVGTGLTGFRGGSGEWKQISISDLVAPPRAREAEILFRFVTGAVAGGSGEVFLDDVSFVRQ